MININGFIHTKEALESLSQNSYSNYSVILIDNGSINNEGIRLKEMFPDLELIRNQENQGFATAMSQGIHVALKKSDCGYVMIVNNDIALYPDTLEILVSYVKKNPRTIVSPQILIYNDPQRLDNLGGKIIYSLGCTSNIGRMQWASAYPKDSVPDYLSGCCFMSTREVFERVGTFFEPYFAYWEDTDWCLHAKRKGYALRVIAKARLKHKISMYSKKTENVKAYYIARNGIIFARRNLSYLIKLFFIGQHILFSLCMGLFTGHQAYTPLGTCVRGLWAGLIMPLKKTSD